MPSLVSSTPTAFAEQIDALRHHATPVSLAEVLDALRDPRRLPPKAVLVTVDDGYADFKSAAWPVLRALGVPVTLFVPTDYPGRDRPSFWWDRLWAAVATSTRDRIPEGLGSGLPLTTRPDRLRAIAQLITALKAMEHDRAMAEVEKLIEALGAETSAAADQAADRAAAAGGSRPAVLDWDELRELASEGVTLAPHTRTHPLLDTIPMERAIAEITGSIEDLEREIGPTPRVLAYPSGAHGGDAVEAARRSGVVLAVTTMRGGNDLRQTDPLRFRRINIGFRTRAPLVRAQLVWASTVDPRRR